MKFLGHGVDLVDIERFRGVVDRQGEHFLRRAFSTAEYEYCQKQQDPTQHFAARFAAKEAFGKAMGLGIGASGDLAEVSVEREGTKGPRLVLSGRALGAFQARGGKEILLSIAHDGGMALASVILVGDE